MTGQKRRACRGHDPGWSRPLEPSDHSDITYEAMGCTASRAYLGRPTDEHDQPLHKLAWTDGFAEGKIAAAVEKIGVSPVFRIAIANTHIVGLGPGEREDRTLTICYKQRKSSRWQTCRLQGHEFCPCYREIAK